MAQYRIPRKIQRAGGRARAKALSRKRRKEIARLGGLAKAARQQQRAELPPGPMLDDLQKLWGHEKLQAEISKRIVAQPSASRMGVVRDLWLENCQKAEAVG